MSIRHTKVQSQQVQENPVDTPQEPSQAVRTKHLEEAQSHLPQSIPGPLGKKLTAAEAERLVSQAGFLRTKKEKRRGFALEDSTQAPIPLPDDEDIEDQGQGRDSQASLDTAQDNLLHNQNILKELTTLLAENPTGLAEQSVWEILLEHQYQPTEEHVAKLTQLVEQPALKPVAAQTASHSVVEHFGLDIQHAAPAEQLLGLSMVVAGYATSVSVGDNHQLAASPLTEGMAHVAQEGQQAVQEARSMSQGIQQHLARQQTFVRAKR